MKIVYDKKCMQKQTYSVPYLYKNTVHCIENDMVRSICINYNLANIMLLKIPV